LGTSTGEVERAQEKRGGALRERLGSTTGEVEKAQGKRGGALRERLGEQYW